MAVNWGLLNPTSELNPVSAFQAGQQAARQKQMMVRQDREFERQDEERARQERLRADLIDAYNPQTGALDTNKARGAYYQAGDIGGALGIDKGVREQQASQLKLFDQAHDQVIAKLGAATDQASYEAALAQGAQIYRGLGADISALNIPPQFSPENVRALQMQALDAKDQIAAQVQQQRFELDRADKERDNARADRSEARTERYQARGDARAARADSRSAVRFRERDKDRAALASSGGGVRSDLADLDY